MPPAPQSQQQPQPGPWAAPPMPPSSGKSRVGLLLAVIGGFVALCVLAAVLVGMNILGGFPRADHTLTLPRTLLDGHYKLKKDASGTIGRTVEEAWARDLDAKDAHAVVGDYRPDGGDQGVLVVTGMYGRFKHTDKVRARVLANGGKVSRVTVLVAPRVVTSTGSGVKVGCEVVTRTWDDGGKSTYPVCAWADGNTWARVAQMTINAETNASDLKAAARTTLRIRSEMVKSIR